MNFDIPGNTLSGFPEESAFLKDVNKNVVLLISAMRSGSTLLKALLATAPDVSDLPEFDFQTLSSAGELWWRVLRQTPERIVVLKRPAWFPEAPTYPRIPEFLSNARKIILVRVNVHDAVISMREMLECTAPEMLPMWPDENLVGYWCLVHERLLANEFLKQESAFWLTYEQLVDCPEETMKKLFLFIGSSQQEGTSSYEPPKGYEWQWGTDDAGGPLARA